MYSRTVTTLDVYGIEGQVLDGQFRVDRAVGEGGFSVVYHGRHIGLDEPVAIKCLKLQSPLASSVVDGLVRRFRDESKIHYRLSQGSLHIARTIAAGTTMAPATGALVPYMVLEWLEGYTLSEELRARRHRGERGRSLPEVIRLLDPIADAMAFAHAQGVVHRDLNPSNIFVTHTTSGQKLKVLDFGVAKVISDHALSLGPRMATIGQIRMFTPAYAAPEQFHDALGPIGSHTDVYSFAVLVVELLADRTPLEGEHIGEYADKALDPARRPTPRAMGVVVGDAVEAVVARAVTVDPSQRPRDIGEFWGMLKNAATRDANQSRSVGEVGFPHPPGLAAPSARGAEFGRGGTAGGLPVPPDPHALPAIVEPPREVADLIPNTRASGWKQPVAQPANAPGHGSTLGPVRSPSVAPPRDTADVRHPPRKATLFQGTPAAAVGGSAPRTPQMVSPLPPVPGPGLSSSTAFAATLATPQMAPPIAPTQVAAQMPVAKPPSPGPRLGDTSPSAVHPGVLPPQSSPQQPRWYTPSLGDDPPILPPLSSQRPVPPSTRKGGQRTLIIVAMVLTVTLVVAAIVANYFAP